MWGLRSALPVCGACRSSTSAVFTGLVGRQLNTGFHKVSFLNSRSLVTANSPRLLKRFYQGASTEQHGDVWRVLLDGKPVKTPKGFFLELPSQTVAQAVAAEWAAQGEHLKTKEMPLTTAGCTAVDLVRPAKFECVERLMPFLAMDTLCFEDENDELAELQAKEWAPVRQWFETHFGVTLGVARGIAPPAHPEETLSIVSKELCSRDEWELSALEIATDTAKSLIVAVALLDMPDVDAEAARRLALLEESFQIERWGLVEGEHDVSHSALLQWLTAVRLFGRKGRVGVTE